MSGIWPIADQDQDWSRVFIRPKSYKKFKSKAKFKFFEVKTKELWLQEKTEDSFWKYDPCSAFVEPEIRNFLKFEELLRAQL